LIATKKFSAEYSKIREWIEIQFHIILENCPKVGSRIVSIYITMIENTNIIKISPLFGITIDCLICLLGFQIKSLRLNVVPIFLSEKETLF
jgi:hypothetical protein